jgi:hypothetical protein
MVAELVVYDRNSLGDEGLPEVAHGAQEERDAALVRPDMSGLARDLGHPDPVLRRIEVVEDARIAIQLVAE